MRIIVDIWPISCNETVLENYAFLVYVYYTHPGYQTSICGKNCAYYIQIFTVTYMRVSRCHGEVVATLKLMELLI